MQISLPILEPSVFSQICASRRGGVRPLRLHPDPASVVFAAQPHSFRQQQRVQAEVEQRQRHHPQLRPCQVKATHKTVSL